MSLPARLLGANPSVQVSSLLSGNLTTPSAKEAFSINSYDSIASTTAVGGASTVVTLNNIPSGYTHLRLHIVGATYDGNGRALLMYFNNDQGAYYSAHSYYQDSATATTSNNTSTQWNVFFANSTSGFGGTTNRWSTWIIDIYNYDDTTKNTTTTAFGGYDGSTTNSGSIGYGSSLYQKTDVVSRIDLMPNYSSGWRAGSTFCLYGIRG